MNGQIFRDKDVLEQAKYQAHDLYKCLHAKTGQDFRIEPVLVFSNIWAQIDIPGNYPRQVRVVRKLDLLSVLETSVSDGRLMELNKVEEILGKLIIKNSIQKK